MRLDLALGTILLGLLALAGTAARERSPAATGRRCASAGGDAAPVSRRAVADESITETEDVGDEDAAETDEEAEPDTGTPAELPREEPPRPPRRVLRIVDGDGFAVPGVRISAGSDAKPVDTDANGEASMEVGDAPLAAAFFDGVARRSVELAGDRTEIVVESLPRLDVSVIDGTSGVSLDPVRFELRRGDATSVEWTGGRRPCLSVDADGNASFSVAVSPPSGFGAHTDTTWTGVLGTRTRAARVVVPVYESTERTFRAIDRDGVPLNDIGVASVWCDAQRPRAPLAEHAVTFVAEPSGADGLMRVRGIPKLPMTLLAFGFGGVNASGEAPRVSKAIQGIDPCAPVPEKPIDVVMNSAGWYRGPAGEVPGCGPFWDYDGPTTSLPLRVVFRDGTPARRVRVRAMLCGKWVETAWTDAEGRVRFTGVPVGPIEVFAVGHGFLPTDVTVNAKDDASAEVREAESRLVRVVVRGADGMPLVSACVVAEAAGWEIAQIDGDVETVTVRTDRTGAATLRVASGKMAYTASLGDAYDTVYDESEEVAVVLTR